jgi:single stranded DNA-binding protein
MENPRFPNGNMSVRQINQRLKQSTKVVKMGGKNIVTLFGRCGKDPVCKEVGVNNTLIAEFSMATQKPPRVKDDPWPTTWHQIKCMGRTAQKVRDRLRKGDFVGLSGEIQVEEWEAKEGGKRSRVVIFIAWPDDIAIEAREASEPAQPQASTEEQW